MPTLIYYDEAAYNAALQQANYLATQLTAVVAQFANVDLPNVAPIVTADLPSLLADPHSWLLLRFLGNGPLLLGTVPVNAHKAFESGLVDKPAGFDGFVEAAKKGREWLASSQAIGLMRAASSYIVANDGTVSFSVAAQQALQPSYQSYTATNAQDALLADLTAICTVLNRLRIGVLSGGTLLGGNGMLNHALIAPMGNDVRPNPDFIINYAR